MSNKPAPRCPGCGAEMRSTGSPVGGWWYKCGCGWKSSADQWSKDGAYTKAMRRYRPEHDGYQGEPTQPVKIWHAAGGGRTR